MRARILVTRPQHDAQPWVRALQARGWEAHALPLMGIGPCLDAAAQQALAQARLAALTPGHYRAVMFVSGNAVQYFFASNSPQTLTHQALLAPDTRAWTPGPGTSRALLAAGIPPSQIDGPAADAAQFESETLWQRVHSQIHPGDRVLIVRGDSPVPETATPSIQGAGRDWLAARLREAGAEVELLAVYQRLLPQWTPQQLELARNAATDHSLWLFSSSEAVANLQQILPKQSWQQARALTTHARIAAKAEAAGFGQVLQSRPTQEEVFASIESAL
ncbi:MAG: uroporphyrinogen-III synthase [Comamonas sp.]|jgi:uroporphyrinogen-III synthase|uniref:uroporphyrinogen-III synthase n=1 Tax=Comamonas sp. TaxID=34028 RepID=UPI00281A3F88|nr:uroporphyrinogen-III synthase [Comamonas sp.]MDR0217004.1 uroporphyrinogen-III synthase [Comamonas sp.]